MRHWSEHELGGDEDCDLDDLRIAHLPPERLSQECQSRVCGWWPGMDAGGEDPGGYCITACFEMDDPPDWFSPNVPTILLLDTATDSGHFAHELLHWLSMCSRGTQDGNHCNGTVWRELLPALGGGRQEASPATINGRSVCD